MSYKVQSIAIFEKQAKKLIKKYPSLKAEIFEIIQALKINSNLGISIGKNCFKIRIAIASKGKGKSGGARIITNFVIQENTIFLLTIYDKTERENITEKELIEFLDSIPE
jgi:hypothetical protein